VISDDIYIHTEQHSLSLSPPLPPSHYSSRHYMEMSGECLAPAISSWRRNTGTHRIGGWVSYTNTNTHTHTHTHTSDVKIFIIQFCMCRQYSHVQIKGRCCTSTQLHKHHRHTKSNNIKPSERYNIWHLWYQRDARSHNARPDVYLSVPSNIMDSL
jgi:hypothetical protein